MMDVMMAEAKATLYGMEQKKIVTDNFDALYDLLVSSLNDEDFRKRLGELKPRGKVTKGIPLKPRMRFSVLLRSFGSAFRGQALIIGLTGIM